MDDFTHIHARKYVEDRGGAAKAKIEVTRYRAGLMKQEWQRLQDSKAASAFTNSMLWNVFSGGVLGGLCYALGTSLAGKFSEAYAASTAASTAPTAE